VKGHSSRRCVRTALPGEDPGVTATDPASPATSSSPRAVAQEDADRMRRVAEGDVRALDSLYVRYAAGTLFPIALVILHDRAEAHDIVHDAFVAVAQRAGQYTRALGTVEGWLIALVRNLAIDRMRRRNRRGTLERDVIFHEPQVAVESPEERVSGAEDAARVRQLLGSLPRMQRDMVKQAYFEGLTYAQIAERERVPVGTVKSRVNRALVSMRDALEAG
jgi:RNA polymerase sigma-70 factor (ECF subfamily)